MATITTHILDISTGRPAQGIDVVLEVQEFAVPSATARIAGAETLHDKGPGSFA
jgi:5-hydroxyisourate hydrolase-like protein (transthyretin family)